MPFSPASRQPPAIHLAWVVLLCTAWVLLGLVGHDPWKPDEAYGFGVVYSILAGGDWVVPMLAGEPFMEKPPLYYLTAAAFARLFSAWLPWHDGARLASGFFMALVLSFTGLTARELWGKGYGRIAAIVMIASLGLLVRTHQLIADVAQLAGFCAAMYALALASRRPLLAGVLMGSGAGVGFLAKGLLVAVVAGAAALLLPLAGKTWRTRGHAVFLALACVAALPWLAIWPFLLYRQAPELFMQWLWLNDPRRFPVDYGHYLSILPWFAWPALPLAIWNVWSRRAGILSNPAILLPLLVFALTLLVLGSLFEGRDVNALPLLPPLAVLATGALGNLRRGAANALDWFSVMTFSLFAVVLWLGWYASISGYPVEVARLLDQQQPGYVAPFNGVWLFLALLLSLAWLAVIFLVKRGSLRSILGSALGLTLVWGLLATIWLPWLDAGKSYRAMIASMSGALPGQYDCIASLNLGEPQRAMLHYFSGITTRRVETSPDLSCSVLLLQGKAGDPAVVLDPAWQTLWKGSRLGDNVERFELLRWSADRAVVMPSRR